MKIRFFLLSCLFAALAFPTRGATLLFEGFDGMTKGNLPKGWECSKKTPDYFTNNNSTAYSETSPSLKFDTADMSITSRTFPAGATNVSFMASTWNAEGACNKFQVNGWDDGEWIQIGLITNMAVKERQVFSFPVENSRITRVQIVFVNRNYNAALDDIRVEGPFSIMCDHEDGFKLPEGTSDTITAMATNDFFPEAQFDYAWSGDLEGTDAALAIPADLAPGTYRVTCTATMVGDGETSTSGSISFRVLGFHGITIEECEHGTVTADAEQAVEGTLVTLAATPESDGYLLSSIATNGVQLPRGTLEFEMPDTNVTVTAVFKKKEEGDLIVTFDDNASKNPQYSSPAFLAQCLSGGVVVSTRFDALLCQGGVPGYLGTDLAMRVKHEGKGANITNGFFATADELEHPIARIGFEYKASSASHTNRDWALETSMDGRHWTNMATVKTKAGWETCHVTNGIPENSFWFRIVSANKGTTARTADFDNINIWYGEAGYRVRLSGVKQDARVVCDADNPLVLTAEGLDGEEPYEFAWTWTTGDITNHATGETCEFSETGDYDEVVVTCTDARGSNACASVHFTLEKQFKVLCPEFTNGCAIVASTNKAFAGDTVTVQAKPKKGWTLEGDITATWSGGTVTITDGAFAMPEGDVLLEGAFRPVEATVSLPYEWHGPWQTATNGTMDGVTAKIGKDLEDENYDGEGNGAANFDKSNSVFQISFDSPPGELSYLIRGESLSQCVCTVFLVQESPDGIDWHSVVRYESELDEPSNDETLAETCVLRPDSRHVKFSYYNQSKGTGAIGVDAIKITKLGGGESVAVKAVIADGGISFGDGTATLTVSLEGEGEFRAEDIEVWAATDLPAADWQPVPGATVEAVDDLYRVAVPILEAGETSGAFISIGKPDFLETQP